MQMKKESLKLNYQNDQELKQPQSNHQLIVINEKKIEEGHEKISQVLIINLDELDQYQSKVQVKIDHRQLSQKQQNDQEYIPEQDVSSSQSVQKYRFYHLRERELKIITKQQFESKLIPNEPIEIVDDCQHSQPQKQKHENVKINFKEEVKGRITKKAKMEFLFKNRGKSVRKIKNKKMKKAIPSQLNNQKD